MIFCIYYLYAKIWINCFLELSCDFQPYSDMLANNDFKLEENLSEDKSKYK